MMGNCDSSVDIKASDFPICEGISLIKNTRASKVFVSAAGVHETLGVTCSNNYEVATKKAILNSSFEKILLLHSEKFGKVNSSYFADLNEFDTIITDANLSDEWKNRIDSLKIKEIKIFFIFYILKYFHQPIFG